MFYLIQFYMNNILYDCARMHCICNKFKVNIHTMTTIANWITPALAKIRGNLLFAHTSFNIFETFL